MYIYGSFSFVLLIAFMMGGDPGRGGGTQGRLPLRALEGPLPRTLEGPLPRAPEGLLPRALEGPLPRALEELLPRALEGPTGGASP